MHYINNSLFPLFSFLFKQTDLTLIPNSRFKKGFSIKIKFPPQSTYPYKGEDSL